MRAAQTHEASRRGAPVWSMRCILFLCGWLDSRRAQPGFNSTFLIPRAHNASTKSLHLRFLIFHLHGAMSAARGEKSVILNNLHPFQLRRAALPCGMMKHAGKARSSAFKIIFWSLVLLLALCAAGVIATIFGTLVAAISSVLITLWLLFALFTLYFFRDPAPKTPTIPNAIVSPAQGKVDLIDETTEEVFMGGRCKRISIFLSVVDVHVQRAPVSGQIVFMKQTLGKFLSATKSDCGLHNENVLMGIAPADYPGQKVALRLIAGLIARRIVPWVNEGETVTRSDRISLIQYGSRCDLYLPLTAKIHAKLNDRVKVGETIVASFE